MLHLREKVFPVGRRNLDAERAISSLVGKQANTPTIIATAIRASMTNAIIGC